MDWFEGRRHWAQLLELISQLPNHSLYKAKLLGDEELAERLAADFPAETDAPHEPPLAGYDPVQQSLDDIKDKLSVLISAAWAPTLKDKTPTPRTVPRPRTGLQKVRSRQRLAKHNEILADFGFNTSRGGA